MSPEDGLSQPVQLAAKVAFLRQPTSYAEQPRRVVALETHMSWVFLTPRHAYKLKKPVKFDFLDYRSLAARRHFCAEEVRLNRTLAPGVYLGMRPLTRAPGGQLQLDGPGEIIDWLVKMRRLPSGLRLDLALRHGPLDPRHLAPALARLATFYRSLPPAGLSAAAHRAGLAAAIDHNDTALQRWQTELPLGLAGYLIDGQRRFLIEQAELLATRASQVVDAHGDLRPEHVYLTAPPVIVDRLEFSRQLRLLDPVDELAFLAMECELLAAPWVAGAAWAALGSAPDQRLIAFYMSLRACMRARLALGHLEPTPPGDSGPWLAQAKAYLSLATRYQAQLLAG